MLSFIFFLRKSYLGCWLLWLKSSSTSFLRMRYIILLLSYLIFSYKRALYFTSIKILLVKWSRLLCISDLFSFFTTPMVSKSFANLLQVTFTVSSGSLIFKIECKARFVERADKFLLGWWHGRGGQRKANRHTVEFMSLFFLRVFKKLNKIEIPGQTSMLLADSLLMLHFEITRLSSIQQSVLIFIYHGYLKENDKFICFSLGALGFLRITPQYRCLCKLTISKGKMQHVVQDLFSMKLCWLTLYIYP